MRPKLPYLALSKKGHTFAVVLEEDSEKIAFITSDDLALHTEPAKAFFKIFAPTEQLVTVAVSHLLAETCRRPFSSGIISPLRRHVPSYLMPEHFVPKASLEVATYFPDGSRRGSVVVAPYFTVTERPTQEIEDMATAKKKPAAKPSLASKIKDKLTTAKKEAAPAEVPATKGARKPGVTALILEQVAKGADQEKIIEMIRAQFPASKAGAKEIAWGRSKLKREGKL